MTTTTLEFTGHEIEERYAELTACLTVEAELVTEMIGGQPAGQDGVESFVKHHLKLVGEEAEAAVQRIMAREGAGPREIAPPEGELKEVESYAVNIIRHTEFGPYIGNWMIKACVKQAASRIGLFKKKIGTKGDFAEGGRVHAIGHSRKEDDRKIYLYDVENDDGDVTTYYRKFRGKVSTPQGSVSIVHDSEVAPPGTRFNFEYRFMNGKTSKDEVMNILALACNCGVGSAKSFECGKFRIVKARLTMSDLPHKEK
jgi:hypothetical protein